MIKRIITIGLALSALSMPEEIQHGKGWWMPRKCPNLTEARPKSECIQVIHATDIVVHDTSREVKAVYRTVGGRKQKVWFGQHRKVTEPGMWTLMVQVNKQDNIPETLHLVYK